MQFQIVWNWWQSAKSVFLLTHTINRCFIGHQVTCWKDRPVTVQVEETRAVSAGPTQEFTKFRFWSSCLGDDLNVTRCPSSCFMKTRCLESTLHIMLSRPIWPCIRKKGWTVGILSMLQLTRSNHGLQWWAAGVVICCRKTQISDRWTRKAGREWHQSQHVSTEHSDLSCLSKDEAFGNTCIVACLSLLHAHSAAKVSGSEFCNIQLACHFIPPCFTSVTLSESQHVSGSSWECVDPNASHYSRLHLGSQLDKQKSTNWLSWSVCYLQVERLAQRTL